MSTVNIDPFEDWAREVAPLQESPLYPLVRAGWWSTHRELLIRMIQESFIGDGTRTVGQLSDAVLATVRTMLDRDVVRNDPDLSIIVTMTTVGVLQGALQGILPAVADMGSNVDCGDSHCPVHGTMPASVATENVGTGMYI